MGGQFAIGVLLADGGVKYYLVRYTDMENVLHIAKITHLSNCEYECYSVKDYFGEDLFEQEDSIIRYLVVKDDTVVYRYYGCSSEYTLTKRTI